MENYQFNWMLRNINTQTRNFTGDAKQLHEEINYYVAQWAEEEVELSSTQKFNVFLMILKNVAGDFGKSIRTNMQSIIKQQNIDVIDGQWSDQYTNEPIDDERVNKIVNAIIDNASTRA